MNTSKLQHLINRLQADRLHTKKADADKKAWLAKHPELAELTEQLKAAQAAEEATRAELEATAVAIFAETKSKDIHPALEVITETVIEWDTPKALAHIAKAKIWHCATVAVGEFKKYIRAQNTANPEAIKGIAKITEKHGVRVASDLSKYITE